MGFKDYFSGHAPDYATYRPHYPAALFNWLAQQCRFHELAWDCATGNGQAAIAIAPHFARVVATDGSAAQLSQAPEHPQITYRVALAHQSGLDPQTVDLVTVAQAVHWFDLTQFYAEVRRVLKPEGLLAIWCYGVPQLAGPADQILNHFYNVTLDTFWSPERHLVETGYRTLSFPFQELAPPAFNLQVDWSLPELLGYLSTWSATKRFIATHNYDPLAAVAEQFAEGWSGDRLRLTWPLHLRVGQVQQSSGVATE